MADTKTTYPDGNTTTKRDANVPNQGGVKQDQDSDMDSNANKTIPSNPNTNVGSDRK